MPDQSGRPVDCIEEFVQRHENRIYRIAITIMGSKADAEDIMQDVFLKILDGKAPLFQSVEHESAWLTRVTVNQCRSSMRAFRRREKEPLLDSYPAQDEKQYELMETVLSLPPKYRIVIYLFYYEGYSTKEIAEITQQKESTVRSNLARARHKLRDFLENNEEGI